MDRQEKIKEILEKKLNVNKIEVNGAKVTRSYFLEPFFHAILGANTLADILKESHDCCDKLDKFGIFDKISVSVEQDCVNSLENTPLKIFSKKKVSNKVNVIFDIQEMPRLVVKTGTEVGSNEASVSASGLVRNLFGGAESLELHFSRGTRTKTSFNLQLKKPLTSAENYFKFRAFQDEEDWGYILRSKGVNLSLNIPSKYGNHEITLSSVWRNFDLPLDSSIELRLEAKPSLKNSISHIYVKDSRDFPFLPSSGQYFKWLNEFAGCGGDASFFKTEIESSVSHNLPRNIIFLSDYKLGLLYPLKERSLLPDRFYLGGPLTVRGFQTRGIGPRAEGASASTNDSLGGDFYLGVGYHLFTPVPLLTKYQSLKTHMFWNGGMLIPVEPGSSIKNIFNDVKALPFSTAFGFGLAYRADVCRVELNVVHPLSASNRDIFSSKIQFGIGINFL